jgi:hypothetical protein
LRTDLDTGLWTVVKKGFDKVGQGSGVLGVLSYRNEVLDVKDEVVFSGAKRLYTPYPVIEASVVTWWCFAQIPNLAIS